MIEVEEKLTNLTTQGAEEIETTEATIIKEVEVAKAASQNFLFWPNVSSRCLC
jgi:hypothetical protein